MTDQDKKGFPRPGNGFPQTGDSGKATKRSGGRPRCEVDPEIVVRLKSAGMSWRRIGRELGIGTATAMRLYRAATDASQN